MCLAIHIMARKHLWDRAANNPTSQQTSSQTTKLSIMIYRRHGLSLEGKPSYGLGCENIDNSTSKLQILKFKKTNYTHIMVHILFKTS